MVFTCDIACDVECANCKGRNQQVLRKAHLRAPPIRLRGMEDELVQVLRRAHGRTAMPNYDNLQKLSEWWPTACRRKPYHRDNLWQHF